MKFRRWIWDILGHLTRPLLIYMFYNLYTLYAFATEQRKTNETRKSSVRIN